MTVMMNPTVTVVQNAIADVIASQTTYRRFANTINAALGGAAGALSALAGVYSATGRIDTTAMVVGFFATLVSGLATRLTKNSLTTTNGGAVIAKVAEQTPAMNLVDAAREAIRAEFDTHRGATVGAPNMEVYRG